MRASEEGMTDKAVFPGICFGTGHTGMAHGGRLAGRVAARYVHLTMVK